MISDEGNIEFVFPCYSNVNVNSTVEADIEFKVTKQLKSHIWSSLLTFGHSASFNTSESEIFVHRVKLIIRTPDSSVKLRRPVTIEISKEQADRCMEHYNHFKDIISTMGGPQDNTLLLYFLAKYLLQCVNICLVIYLSRHLRTMNKP